MCGVAVELAPYQLGDGPVEGDVYIYRVGENNNANGCDLLDFFIIGMRTGL